MTASATLSVELRAEMAELDDRIATYDHRWIREIFRTSEQCQGLGKIEASARTATTVIAAVGNRTCFKNAVNSRLGSAGAKTGSAEGLASGLTGEWRRRALPQCRRTLDDPLRIQACGHRSAEATVHTRPARPSACFAAYLTKIPHLGAASAVDRDMTFGSFCERTFRPISPALG